MAANARRNPPKKPGGFAGLRNVIRKRRKGKTQPPHPGRSCTRAKSKIKTQDTNIFVIHPTMLQSLQLEGESENDQMVIGVSIILRQEEHYLFEIQKTTKWVRQSDGRFRIGMGCIGGRVEDSETAQQALKREVKEEVGCGVLLEKSAHSFLFGPSKTVQEMDEEDLPEGSQFLWEEEQPGYIPGAQVAVYLGRLIGHPIPGDLPGVIGLKLGALFEMKDRAFTVGELLESEGILLEREHIPRDAEVCPVGTAKILTELQEVAPDVVNHLFEKQKRR